MNTSEQWFVYVLLCDGKSFYIGITNNVADRLKEHRSKMSLHTKRFSNIEFIYAEQYSGKHTAAKREKQLKGWIRAKKQQLINGKPGLNTCTEHVQGLLGDGSNLNNLS